jgi:hypothetical protein
MSSIGLSPDPSCRGNYGAVMSIKVELEALADEMQGRPTGYLLTAGEDGPPHSSAATFVWDGETIVTGAGRTTVKHVASRSTVSLLFAPPEPGGYSLIVDGDAHITGDGDAAKIHIMATWAVLHRPAGDAPSDSGADCPEDYKPL